MTLKHIGNRRVKHLVELRVVRLICRGIDTTVIQAEVTDEGVLFLIVDKTGLIEWRQKFERFFRCCLLRTNCFAQLQIVAMQTINLGHISPVLHQGTCPQSGTANQ